MEFNRNKPICRQIADHFYENILTGQWKSGEKIPSVREVAVSLEVNPNTAVRAYEMLQNQGVIYNKRGIGYFVAEDGYEKVLQLKQAEFREQVLPDLFRQMTLVKIDINEVKNLYNNHLKAQQNEDQ